jgi:beta-glucanase (GH16 family)
MRSSFRHVAVLCIAVAALVIPAAGASAATPSRTAGTKSLAVVTTPSCGGVSVAKPGGGTWKCTFDDEFDATTGDASSVDPSKWVAQTTAASGFTAGPVCFENSPNNISVANGALNLTVRKEASTQCAGTKYATPYSAGELMTYGKFNQAYGRWQIRAKFPSFKGAGLQTSLWLWPQNQFKYGNAWPESGEIDMVEEYSYYNYLGIPYIHYVPSSLDTHVTNTRCTINVGQFNTYTLVWTASTLTITFNNNTTPCIVDTWKPGMGLLSPAPFDQPFFMSLTQGLGIQSNAFNASTTQLPATTQVDYVRVWS